MSDLPQPAVEACCDPVLGAGALLSSHEQRLLALRLSFALLGGGLLVIAVVIGVAIPGQREVAELVAATAALLVAGPVFVEAWHSLRSPSLHGITDLLVAAAVIAAWVVGDLESAALVPLAMIVGHILEERSLLGSIEAINALGRLTKTTARRLDAAGAVSEVPAEALAVGQTVECRPGDRIPADGVVRSGASSIDSSPITGESVPVEAALGDQVHAGTINLSGRLVVEVTRTGANTTLGMVAGLMREAESAKPPITRLLERYAGHYLLLILLLAAATLFATGSVTVMMTVLVASCPCALVLAAPATAIAALAVTARHGILVKGTAFLEELADVDCVVLDKTGTVTLGELRLVGVAPASDNALDAELVRRYAASLGAGSNHPVSRALALLVPAEQRLAIADVQEVGGKGVSGSHDGVALVLGRAELLRDHGVTCPPPPDHDGPVVGLARGGRFVAWFLLADEPREEARAALDELRALGLTRQILLTGDRRRVAEAIAARLGIDRVEAEVLPQQKLATVLAEIAAGRQPLVVGDGINDALALKAGAVGVAMGGHGSDIALASADVVLMSSDLRRLGTAIRLSRLCRRTINVNVLIGLGWTVLIVAGAAFRQYGPVTAVILHNIGTLAVMANAGRLLQFDDGRGKR